MKPEQKSLVLITVDCLRADHCGFHGYSRHTTPFLDSLAAESFVVPQAVVAGAPTYYSFPAILASRMPLALGRDVIGLAPGEPTLATVLRDAGYATAAFSAANPYVSPRFGYDQGFEVFQDFLDFELPGTHVVQTPAETRSAPASYRTGLNRSLKAAAQAVGLGRLYDDLYFQYCVRIVASPVTTLDALRKFPSAEVLVDHAISWLASTAERPFFLWLHLMDTHSPYYPAPVAFSELTGRALSARDARYLNEFWNRFDVTPERLEKKKDSIVELYDSGIRSADDHITRLVARLRQSGHWENCTVVLTADHGEEFLDHGGRYHAPTNLCEELTRVPLLIRVPAVGKKQVPYSPFSQLHLAPTLLEILDVPAPTSFQGRSLWRNLQQGATWDDPAVTECIYGCTNPFRAESRTAPRLLSVRGRRHKLVMRLEPRNAEQIFDLQADPKEENPLPPDQDKSVRGHLLHAAREHLRKTSTERDVTARLKARLRDLRVELQSKSP